jgi:hypothetical protein
MDSHRSAAATRLNLASVSATFPEQRSPTIWRENVLDYIGAFFEGGGDIAIVTGETGVGKTALLAQFAMRYSRTALSLFIRGSSRTAYHPDFLRRDLSNQVHWATNGREASFNANEEALRNQLYDLRRKARRSKEEFYFVVDGLHEIPDADRDLISVILDMLPFGLPGFRYIISGDVEDLAKFLPHDQSRKTFPVYNFADGEAERFLEGSGIRTLDLREVVGLTRGNPGKLSQVRRLLETGTDPERLLHEVAAAGGLYEAEWTKAQASDPQTKEILALLAFGQRDHTLDSLAYLLQVEPAVISSKLGQLNFVQVQGDGIVRYVTDPFAAFVRNQLAHLEEEVHSKAIDRIAEQPGAESSPEHLTDLYYGARKFDALLAHLSGDQYMSLLDQVDSLYALRHITELGYSASDQLNRTGDCLRFGVEQCIIREVSTFAIRHPEVEARLAVDDYDSALALAQASPVDVERMHLLAIVHKYRASKGLAPEPEIQEQIRQTFSLIEEPLDRDRALEVATDLVHCCPDLAIALIEQSAGTDEADPNSLDWAFAVLSLAAAGKEDDGPNREISERISDPTIRDFTSQASFLATDKPATEFLEGIEHIQTVSSRLFIIRQWISANPLHPDAYAVVEYGVKLAIQAPDYSPNARILRDLAAPLAASETHQETASSVIGLLDVQRLAIKELGPIQDYVELQLILTEAEAGKRPKAAEERALEAYMDAVSSEPPTARLRALAAVIGSVSRLKASGRFQDEADILNEALSEFHQLLEELLRQSAEHFDLVRHALVAFADSRLDEAVRVAEKLNTQARRDAAFLTIVRAASERQARSAPQWRELRDIIGKICDVGVRDHAISAVIANASHRVADATEFESFLMIAGLVGRIGDSVTCSKAHVNAIRCAYRAASSDHPVVAGWLKDLDSHWDTIDTPWRKVDAAFGIASDLAEYLPETAVEWIRRADGLREETIVDTKEAAWVSGASVRLALRAYAGLLPREIDTTRDLRRLKSLIKRLPSTSDQIELLADVALRQFSAGRSDLGRTTVAEEIKPLLQHISNEDQRVYAGVLVSAAPALFIHHPKTALEYLDQLEVGARDDALQAVVRYILTKHPPSDAYDAKEGRADLLSFEECIDIIDLIAMMDLDLHIESAVNQLVRTVQSRQGRKFTTRNRRDLADRLSQMVVENLPKRHHIDHLGYVVLCNAHLLGLKGGSGQEWGGLLEEARGIPNSADRAFVLAKVLAKMPVRHRSTHADSVVEEALALSKELPLVKDRLDRLQNLAESVGSFKRSTAKLALEAATDTLRGDSDKDNGSWPKYRALIEAAYEIDEETGASIASIIENDERLSTYQKRIHAIGSRRQAQDRIADGSVGDSSPADETENAWRFLGSVNASRRRPVGQQQVSNWLAYSRKQSLTNAYPFLALAIENTVRDWSKKDQAVSHLRPLFEATCVAAEVGQRILAKAKNKVMPPMQAPPAALSERQVLVGIGEWPKAEAVLREWSATRVRDYVKIIDPHFGPEDLHVLALLVESRMDVPVQIVSTMKRQRQVIAESDIPAAYARAWTDVSDDTPPATEVIIVDIPDPSPLHDRYLLTNGSGLRIGTSLHSLGRTSDSSMEWLSSGEAAEVEAQVDPYLNRQKRVHNDHRVSYQLFTL